MKPQSSFLNAVKWAYMCNWGDRAFSALFTFILAALLGPRDFGVVAIALIYLSFMQMLLDQGFVAALIQRKELKQEHCDAVFWMTVSLSVLLVALTVTISGFWARINHSPELAKLLSVMSVSILFEGLSIVQSALLRRNMDFKSLAIRSNVAVVIGGAVGIGMAAAHFGAWSLVGQQLARDFSALLLLWRMGDWRPRAEFAWRNLRGLMSFSLHNFFAQLAIFADMQAGSLALGVLFGPVAVGLYRLADRLTNSVVVMATSSIQSVALPEFSRLQDRPDELRKSALSCIRLSASVTVPALAGMAVMSGPILRLLGPKWNPAEGALQILSCLGVSLVLSYFTGPLLQALGRPKQLAILEWARMALGLACLAVTALFVKDAQMNWQVTGIALARFVPTVFVVTPVFLYILMHFCKLKLRDLVFAMAPSITSAASIVVSVLALQWIGLFATARPVTVLTSQAIVGGLVGGVSLVMLDKTVRSGLSKMVTSLHGWATSI